MIKFQFKNTITHNQFEQIININKKLDKLKEQIANNVYTSFNLEINEFDIIDNSINGGENGIPINSDENITFKNKYDKNINYMAFYIKPRNIIDEECPVCYESFRFNYSSNIFNCSHALCNNCHLNWQNNCIANERVFNCPLCRRT